jgi:hypothetical protein
MVFINSCLIGGKTDGLTAGEASMAWHPKKDNTAAPLIDVR